MRTQTMTIQDPHGLHFRVAARVVQASQKHQSKVVFHKDGKHARAESILELLILEATHQADVTVTAEGIDEERALQEVGLVLMDGAGI